MLNPYIWNRCCVFTLFLGLLQNLREGFDDGNVNSEDCSKFINYETLKNWKDEELIQSIRDRFVTGDWEKAKSRNKYPEANAEDDDDAVYGDFEDLEAGEKNERHRTDDTGNGAVQMEDDPAAEERRLKKLALRAKFDAQYRFELLYFQYTFLCDPIATPSFSSLSFLGCSCAIDGNLGQQSNFFCPICCFMHRSNMKLIFVTLIMIYI